MDNEKVTETTAEVTQPAETKPAEKTFTRDELNKIVATEKSKALDEYKKEQEAKQSEAEKLSKMKEQERFDYELKKEKEISANAIAELESYKLKDETIKQASEKGLPVELVDFIEFKGSNAETVKTKLEEMSTAFNNAVQRALDDKLKQKAPYQNSGGTTTTAEKAYLDEKYKNNPWYNK